MKRIPFLWLGVACCSFALANLKVDMFGTGVLDWAHFRFEWTIFIVGMIGVAFSTVKAYHDQSATKPSEPTYVQVVNPPTDPIPVEQTEIQP